MNWIKGYNHEFIQLGNGLIDAYVGIDYMEHRNKYIGSINGMLIKWINPNHPDRIERRLFDSLEDAKKEVETVIRRGLELAIIETME